MPPVSVLSDSRDGNSESSGAACSRGSQSANAIFPGGARKDPYRIWISEIMLQQTRVAAVIPYYEQFRGEISDGAGAGAREDRKPCSGAGPGLGITAAPEICIAPRRKLSPRHGGHFPRDYEAALALPGIGRYTAAAVLSIAYDQPLAVLDGNVARVLARIGRRARRSARSGAVAETGSHGAGFARSQRSRATGTRP